MRGLRKFISFSRNGREKVRLTSVETDTNPCLIVNFCDDLS